MTKTGKATPALQVLERAGAWYRVYQYDHESSSQGYGVEAAQKLGIDRERIYKTLIVESNTGHLANAVLAVADMLSLKDVAQALGVKRVQMADTAKAQQKTGYVLGGISPLGQKSRLTTLLDDSVLTHDTVWVSGGQRGLSLELRTEDLVELIAGQVRRIRRSS